MYQSKENFNILGASTRTVLKCHDFTQFYHYRGYVVRMGGGAVFPYTAEIGIWQLQHLAAGALQISQGVTNSKKRNVPSSRDQY